MSKQRKPRLLSLCTGIGGIDLAWEMAGGVVAGQCEIDPFCQHLLAKHWPDVKRVSDIRNVWGDSYDGPIDLVAGGIPCQPWSVAGLRRGHADDRHLWPAMRRIIEIYQPAWVLVENVSGFIGMALDDVLADLEAAGYEAGTLVLPAAAVGAPHRRERVFVVAHAISAGAGMAAYHHSRQVRRDAGTSPSALVRRADGQIGAEGSDAGGREVVGHAASEGLPLAGYGGQSARSTEAPTGLELQSERHGVMADDDCERRGADIQLHRAAQARKQVSARRQTRGRDANDARQRQAQSAVGGIADGIPRGLDGTARDDGLTYPYQPWPAGPGQAQYDWEAPRTTQERIPRRAARLKALGNAVVPQQVYPILAAIIEQWRQEKPQIQDEIEVTA